MKICVLGLGYVGLTLSTILADVGFNVVGVDINKKTIEMLQNGKPHIHEPGLEFMLRKHINKRLVATSEIPHDKEIHTYIICVATPVDTNKKPITTYVERAITEVSKHLKKGDLVVLRSTVPLGTTSFVKNIIDKEQSLKVGEDIHLVFAPERTMEGKALEELGYLPQVIGGINEESVNKAVAIFGKTTNTIVRVSSVEAAEMIKQLDNIFRDVNIALGNEIGMACEELGLNAHEIIKGANTGYQRNKIMLPGAGVGGACLTKDPYIFLSQLKNVPKNSLIFNSRKINEYMPTHVVETTKRMFTKHGKDMKGAKIVILGFAFKGKPETDDTRHSPTFELAEKLKELGADVHGFDPLVNKNEIEKYAKLVTDYEKAFAEADCVIVMNNHHRWGEINFETYSKMMKKPAIVIDGWNVINREEVERVGIVYKGVGIG